jgi:hypothetical protein
MFIHIGLFLNGAQRIASKSFPPPFVVPGNPRGAVWYDSIAWDMRSNAGYAGSYNDQMESLFGVASSSGTQQMGTHGAFLLKSVRDTAGLSSKYMINDSAGSDPALWVKSADFDNVIAANTSPNDSADYAFIMSGVNDSNASGGNTRTKHKQALMRLMDFIQEAQPNIQFAVVNLVHRQVGGGDDTTYQATREGTMDAIAQDSRFHMGICPIDLDHVDSSHFTDTVYRTDFSQRCARIVAKVCGKAVNGGLYGAEVTQAAWEETASLLCTITHEAGSDLTTPAGCEDMFGLDVGGTVYQPSNVERVMTLCHDEINAAFALAKDKAEKALPPCQVGGVCPHTSCVHFNYNIKAKH